MVYAGAVMCYVNSPLLASLRDRSVVAGGEVERLLQLHGAERYECVLYHYCLCRRGARLGRVGRKGRIPW
jgi:hypothetical protein